MKILYMGRNAKGVPVFGLWFVTQWGEGVGPFIQLDKDELARYGIAVRRVS